MLKDAEKEGNTDQFFYLNISLGGLEEPAEASNQPTGMREVESMDSNEPMNEIHPRPAVTGPNPQSDEEKEERKKMRNKFRNENIPKVLKLGQKDGWKKVVDKDGKSTYQSLYFNFIAKDEGEDEDSYIQRVNRTRKMLAEEGEKLRAEYPYVKPFKINSLLSKAFVYEEPEDTQ